LSTINDTKLQVLLLASFSQSLKSFLGYIPKSGNMFHVETATRTQQRVIPGVCVPVSGIKVRSLVGLSAHTAFH